MVLHRENAVLQRHPEVVIPAYLIPSEAKSACAFHPEFATDVLALLCDVILLVTAFDETGFDQPLLEFLCFQAELLRQLRRAELALLRFFLFNGLSRWLLFLGDDFQ